MRKRIYIKNKQFFKNFIILLTVLFVIIFLVTGSLYWMMFQTLQQEIKGVNETVGSEMTSRMDEALDKCKKIAIRTSLSELVQLYFISSEPKDYREDYNKELLNALTIQEPSYIDSVVLYAPEYARIYDSKSSWEYHLTEEGIAFNELGNGDVSWLETYEAWNRSDGVFFTHCRNEKWPFYLTYMLPWQSGEKFGVIMVNIDLEKLYDYLFMGRSESIQFYMVDEEQRVFMKADMEQLYTDMETIEELEAFRIDDSYAEIREGKDQTCVYVQHYMEDYGFTCVTTALVGDYFIRLTQIQTRIFTSIFTAIVVAVILACVYSIKLVKPHEDNAVLKQELEYRQDLLRNTQLLALQTQINPHFMFNTLNIANLMIESEDEESPVVQILSGLSDILRYSLAKKTNVSIREEVACAEKYIFIMKYRYGEFESIIEVDDEIEDYSMPKLILQPLIENALQHGIAPSMGVRTGSIRIQIKEMLYTYKNGKELTSVCIDVRDNGMGVDEEKLAELKETMNDHQTIFKDHIGLFNVAQRFWLLFHEEQEVTIDSEFGKGTHVKLVFPLQEDVNHDEDLVDGAAEQMNSTVEQANNEEY